MMKKLFLCSLLLVCGTLLFNTKVAAQCSTVYTSSVTASNDTTLPCGTQCTNIGVRSYGSNIGSTTAYTVSSIPYAPQSYTAGTNAFPSTVDDQFSPLVPIGFTFCYFGQTYTQVCVGANGQVNFRAGQAGGASGYIISNQLPNTDVATRGCIMSPHHDLLPTIAGSTIKYVTIGVAPCRMFIVSWNTVGLFNAANCPGLKATQQIVMYETTNIIDINIANKPECTNWNDGYAQTGIENPAGTVAYVAPGENSPPTWGSRTNESWRFTPSGPATWSFTWYSYPPLTPIGTGATINVCPTATSQTYIVKAVANAACDSTVAWDTVIVSKISTMPPISGPVSVCVGGNIQLINPAAGGTWTSSNPGVANINQTTGSVTGISTGTANITYSINAICEAYYTVSVYPLDPITGVTKLCQNTTSTLANSAPSGTWSSGNPAVATMGLTTGVVYGVSAGTALISYMLPGGCMVTTTVTIDPQLPITGTMSLCARGTAMLSNAVAGGAWSITPTTIATIDPTTGQVYGVDPPGTSGGGGTATARYVTADGCISTVPVTINPTPAIPVIAPVAYCHNFTPADSLRASHITGASLSWYGPGVIPGSYGAPVPRTDSVGADTFYVTQTSLFGCTSDSGRTIVYTDPKPAPPIPRGEAYCEGATNITPLDQNVIHTGTLNWYDNRGVILPGVPHVDSSIVTYPNGTTWYVSQDITIHTTCRSDSVAITDTIKNVPDFQITTRLWICQADSMMLNFTNQGMAVNQSYFWQLPDDASFAGGSKETDANVLVAFDSVHSHNFVTLTVTDLGCVASDTVDIKVVALPTASSATRNQVCMSDTVTLALSARSPGAEDFIWLIDNTPLFSSSALTILSANSNHGGPYKVRWVDTGKHFISLQAITVEGCTSLPVADTVDVLRLPTATFTFKTVRPTLCIDDSVLFTANEKDSRNLYVWEPVRSFNNVNSPVIHGRVESSDAVITLTVTNPFGCVATSEQLLQPQPCCIVPFPNAFTPNGDSKNDVFRPIPTGALHSYHFFRVANRWGQTIYSSTDNTASWDGTLNGVPQDMGVYYYYLKYDCDGKTLESKGDVTLIR